MSDTDLTITLVGIFQLLFGVFIGWLRWGRACKPRHDWAPRMFGYDYYEQCTRCEKVR